jgi:hypothetical protein
MAGDPWKRRHFEGVVVFIGEGYGDDGGKDARDGEGEMQMTGSEDHWHVEDIRKERVTGVVVVS